MEIENIHQRLLACNLFDAACLIDDLAKQNASLWPSLLWPREAFDGPLALGAVGAHGGTRYVVDSYQPGQSVSFRFIHPPSYQGFHRFDLAAVAEDKTLLKHTVKFTTKGLDLVIWQFFIRWVHDSLIENAFDEAERHVTGLVVRPHQWPRRVYFYRYLIGISRLLITGSQSMIKNNKEEKIHPLPIHNLTLSPLCNVIIGFRNYTVHATRSKYISFSLEKEPEMSRLLLQIATGRLSKEAVAQWPERLVNQLIEYGFLKAIRGWSERLKNAFKNPLNENRSRVITYKGQQYCITSFVFMAFNSQLPKQFIRETVVLPSWCPAFADAVFRIYQEGISPALLQQFPPAIMSRLQKHGVLIQSQDYPELDTFFKNKGQLSSSLCQLIPVEQQDTWLQSKASTAPWLVNPQVYLLDNMPTEWDSRIYNRDWVLRVKPTIILEDPVTKVLSLYWLSEQQTQAVSGLLDGSLSADNLDEANQQLFAAIYLIERADLYQQRVELWQERIAQAKKEMEETGSLVFHNLIQPVYLALTRHYMRHLLDNKYLILDKANGGTKKRYWQHRDDLTFFIQSQVCTILNQILPQRVKIGHNAITIYQPGAVLPKHKDDVLAFAWVMSVPIDTTPVCERDNAWPIYVEKSPQAMPDKAMLGMGDGALINPQMPHWRDALEGHSLSILFLWFIPETFQGYVNGNWIA